ncbi:acyltransferase [Candidatus Planktophila limnetica]|uniref:Acyltransferase n=1 Tax=Candidatus Planktophila limnetica TaxID=573600 RepID=A0A249LGK8_9ACTN|nr:acyltransferase family protein [Candidatus Planktophila limnetica]ASY28137.1 acyltransferase [Candidatus Planktophila limnetica]
MSAQRGIRYIPAIDGLRAVAVIAVMLYHLGVPWIPGGFLGVDLFFVISGYVITRLLLDSIQRSGGLDLRAFYKSRLRRLLPPLVFMIVTTTLFIGVWAPDTIKRLLTDTPFSLMGVMNWWLVFRQADYFEAIGRPPLLQHTWSLGVEAQFYLVWPLILLLVLRQLGRKIIPAAALIIAIGSGVALFLVSLSVDSSSSQSISHVYFGTDTHSIGLFLGAALAVNWIPQNLKVDIAKRAQDVIDGIGVFGFLGILACFLFIEQGNPTLYKIAFPLAGIFGCAIIMSVVHPASRFAPLLQGKAILWIGERSYAIYLWHWIIFQVTRPSVDLAGASWALYALRILIVFALADISLRWVELPFRNGYIESWFRGMKYRTKKVRVRQQTTLALSIISVLAATSLVSANAIAISERNLAKLKLEITSEAQVQTQITNPSEGLWVAGDSVILGIRNELSNRRQVGLINAHVGRQAPELIEVLNKDKARMLGAPIIVNMGNNNRLGESEVVSIFEAIKDQPQIIVINTAVPRGWKDENNSLIQQVASRYQNVKIVDWNAISQGHPEYFAPDGVHLVPTGISVYVDAIVSELE